MLPPSHPSIQELRNRQCSPAASATACLNITYRCPACLPSFAPPACLPPLPACLPLAGFLTSTPSLLASHPASSPARWAECRQQAGVAACLLHVLQAASQPARQPAAATRPPFRRPSASLDPLPRCALPAARPLAQPVWLHGSLGREAATGRGTVFAIRELFKAQGLGDIKNKSFVIQVGEPLGGPPGCCGEGGQLAAAESRGPGTPADHCSRGQRRSASLALLSPALTALSP